MTKTTLLKQQSILVKVFKKQPKMKAPASKVSEKIFHERWLFSRIGYFQTLTANSFA